MARSAHLILIISSALLTGLLLAASGLPPAAAQGSPPAPAAFSLDEIIATALAHNPGLAASRADVEAAQRRVEVSQTLGLPIFSLTANYQYLPTPGLIAPLETTPLLVQHPAFSGGVAGIGFTVPLYTGGRIPLQIRVAQLGHAIAEHRLAQTEQDLIFNLSSLYYTALRLDATVVATQQSVSALESARDVENQFLQVGKAARLDLLRVEARLANVSQDLIRVQNAETVVLAGIATLMGSQADTPIRLAGALADPPPSSVPTLHDVPALTTEALQHRPDYFALLTQARQQDARVRLARAQLLPAVSVAALYGAQGNANVPTQAAGRVLVGIDFPLVDATLTARVREEEAALLTIQHRLEQRRLGVGLDVEKAVVAIQDAAARMRAAEAGLAQAREALRDEELSVRLGKGITTDLLQAQAELLRAEVTDDDARADYQIALVQLRQAMGTLEAPRTRTLAR